MSDTRELSLERLSVAAKGRDDLEPYIDAARAAGATEDQIERLLRRLLRETYRRDVG